MFYVRYSPHQCAASNAGLEWPDVDISETDKDLIFNFDIPGALKEDIKIWINNDILTVSGEKKVDSNDKLERLVSERAFGKFERSFRLPDAADRNKVTAELVNGVLVIKLPKVNEAKEISIN